jgi:hypothetical protein
MKNFFALGISLFMSLANANDDLYKIVIFSDEGAILEAKKFKEQLKQQRPFSYLGEKVVIEVVTLPAEKMDCKDGLEIKRLITCNDRYLQKMQAKHKANLAAVYTSTAHGGSGGSIPKMSNNYESSLVGLTHEILHTFGFSDEYTYSPEETKVYCVEKMTGNLNVAYFNDSPPYESDIMAKEKHQSEIPWMGHILGTTLITSGTKLGTSPAKEILKHGNQSAGLYPGGDCSNTMKTWRPYEESLMKTLNDPTIYPIYEERILEVMNQAGGYHYQKPDSNSSQAPCDLKQNFIEKISEDIEEIIKKAYPKSIQKNLNIQFNDPAN